MTVRELYPNVRPKLLCNYAKAKVLDARSTYSRASAATYWDQTNTLREVTTNQARFEHDPVSGVSEGLLIEGQRTNLISNPRAEGVVAGTPGTFPTQWTSNGANRTVNGTTVVNGQPLVDVSFNIAASSSFEIPLISGYTVSASQGETYTLSCLLALDSGSTISGLIQLEYRNSAGTLLGGANSTTISSVNGVLRRLTVTGTTPANTARLTSQYRINTTSATALRIRIGCPQLERASFYSSQIFPAVGAIGASTRASDSVQISLSALEAPTSAAGTYVIKYQVPQLATTANQVICELNSGAVSQVTRLVNQPSRTNYVRNPRAEGASAGTPGTLPTNFATVLPGGITRTVVGYTTIAGIPGIEIRFQGTPSETSSIRYFPDGTTGLLPITANQSCTSSMFICVTSGSMSGISSTYIQTFYTRVDGTTGVGNEITTITPSSLLTRFSFASIATNDATLARARSEYGFSVTINVAVDVTFFFGWPQFELGSFATSPLLPPVGAPATSTRAAGTITLASEHTAIGHYAYADIGTISANTNSQVVLSLDGAGTIKACEDGGTVSTLTGAATSGFTTLVLGNDVSGNSALFGTIGTQSVYLGASVTDTQLQSLSKVGT